MRHLCSSLVLFFLSFLTLVLSDDISCSSTNPCTEGCCSKLSNVCGYGPDYCSSTNCITAASTNGTCSQLAECDPGVYPGWGDNWGTQYASSENCPLNVCCSEYGFCGTTTDFCGDTTVVEPVCDGTSATKRTIAYYEGWNSERACDTMPPEDIPIGGYTHINFAFLYIDPDLYTITPMETSQQELYSRVTALKKRKSDLEVWISIGGWAFNDPGSTANTFSELVASKSKQSTFFASLLSFLYKYGFDGVDLDWEYPVDSDRGGSDADFDNYATFLANLRSALDSADYGYGLTITLPSSYWYLKNFDIVEMAKSVDWFNIMTYDLHGGWDADDPWIGSVVNAHTNLTEIVSAMDLLWRNNIPPSQVTMGLGFYGRSFTLNDTSCVTAGCPFSAVGNPGDCTNSGGTLSFSEIEAILKDESRGATQTYDETSAVQIVTFDGNQWVSYDNWASFQAKLDYANSRCIGGTMVWAVSLDVDGTATNGLTGTTVVFPGDDGSNGGSEDVYIGPDLWTNATQEISCEPPCIIILPPFPLQTPITIDWPEYETTIASSSDGAILTKTTTITVAPFAIGEIPFWPITVAETGALAYLSPMQSIAPPTFGLTLPQSEATFPLFHTDYSATLSTATSTANGTAPSITTPAAVQSGIVSDCTEFYQAIADDGCYTIATAHDITLAQFIEWNPAVNSDCSGLWVDEYYCVAVQTTSTTTTSYTPIAVTFFDNSHVVTVAPQPTGTSVQPPGTSIPILTYSDGEAPSNGACSSGGETTGCGSIDCSLFGCGGECGFFGCDGGCGLGFCGGGCGLLGCGPGCGGGSCLKEGGGGGSEEEETSTSESCSATATPSVTTVCDYACPDGASTSCATLCTSLTITCEPARFVNFSPGTVDADGIPVTLLDASDEAITSAAEAVASWLNPLYTGLDPVMTSGTTMTASATAPAVTTSTSKTTATAISASSCDIKSTSSSSYCSCDGGYGVTLSTKANKAQTTFLVCDVTPALTISTILPKTTSTKTTSTTTSSASESTSTGFALYMSYWSASECPIGLTCESGSKWNAVYVEDFWGDEAVVPLKGTWNQGGMVDGSKATFCDQTSTFTIDGDDIKGSSSDSKYGSYVCKKHAVPEDNTYYDSENTVSFDITKTWECLTDICKS